MRPVGSALRRRHAGPILPGEKALQGRPELIRVGGVASPAEGRKAYLRLTEPVFNALQVLPITFVIQEQAGVELVHYLLYLLRVEKLSVSPHEVRLDIPNRVPAVEQSDDREELLGDEHHLVVQPLRVS